MLASPKYEDVEAPRPSIQPPTPAPDACPFVGVDFGYGSAVMVVVGPEGVRQIAG